MIKGGYTFAEQSFRTVFVDALKDSAKDIVGGFVAGAGSDLAFQWYRNDGDLSKIDIEMCAFYSSQKVEMCGEST